MTARIAVFRADASKVLGAGHIVRTLALLQAVRELDVHCILVTRNDSAPYLNTLNDQNIDVHYLEGAEETEPSQLKGILPEGCQWLVIDHYGRDQIFEKACSGWADNILALDDCASRFHCIDMLTDPTPKDPETTYRDFVGPSCKLLIGPSYVLLRPEFHASRKKRAANSNTQSTDLKRIFVNMGGSDPRNVTGTIIEAIAQVNNAFEVDVVLPIQPASECHAPQTKKVGRSTVTYHCNLKTTVHLMEKADLAIGASGSSSWERCCLGLPSIAIVTAENQTPVANYLEAAGALIVAGTVDEVRATHLAQTIEELAAEPTKLSQIGSQAWRICDGLGTLRITGSMFPVSSRFGAVTLRPATLSDADQILVWQMEPGTREFFRNPEVPTRDQHLDWLTRKLKGPDCLLNIVETDGVPCGFLRLEKDLDLVDCYEISILIAQAFQNGGVGKAALEQAKILLCGSTIKAEVDPANSRSQSLFRAAGYTTRDGRIFSLNPSAGHD